MISKNLSFERVLITGASSGLGAEIARQIATVSGSLLLSGRDEKNLQTLAGELPGYVEWIACDLSQTQGPLLQWIRVNSPDLVINNAGFTVYGDCLDHFADQQKIFAVNATSAFELTLEAARSLREKKKSGCILNIASAASLYSFPALATYAASKAFLVSFSKSFDAEMQSFGVRILVNLPGPIATPFSARAANVPDRPPRKFAMAPEKAARLIIRQIVERKNVAIIDWRSRLAYGFSRLIPRSWLEKRMRKHIYKSIDRQSVN
jgi:uncharacterized protein